MAPSKPLIWVNTIDGIPLHVPGIYAWVHQFSPIIPLEIPQMCAVNCASAATGEPLHRQRIFGKRILGITFIPNHVDAFVCQSKSTMAVCERHTASQSLQIVRKLLTATAIASNRTNLSIRRVTVDVTAADNAIIIAALLDDDSLHIFRSDGNGTFPANVQLAKHIYPLQCRDWNANVPPSNRCGSRYYDVCDFAFACDGSELWVADADAHISIIETHDWHAKHQICIENRLVRQLLRVPDQLARALCKQPMSSTWIGTTDRNELLLLYHDNGSGRKCHRLTVLDASTTLRNICMSADGQTLIAGFANGKLHLYSMAIVLRRLLRRPCDGLNATNDRVAAHQTALDRRVSVYGHAFNLDNFPHLNSKAMEAFQIPVI